jgi:hypothetical protein
MLGMTICYVVFDGRRLPFGSDPGLWTTRSKYVALVQNSLRQICKTMDPAVFYLLMWMLEHEAKDRLDWILPSPWGSYSVLRTPPSPIGTATAVIAEKVKPLLFPHPRPWHAPETGQP